MSLSSLVLTEWNHKITRSPSRMEDGHSRICPRDAALLINQQAICQAVSILVVLALLTTAITAEK